jgi:hypothetical protein
MEILSLCTDEKISFDQIYSSAKQAVSTTIQNQPCTPETKKLLAQNKINKKAWINQRNAISNNDLFTALGLKITKDEIIVPK